MKLDRTLLKSFPKVLLHEHLDGVLRPQTIIELADNVKYADLPARTPEALGQWFQQGANRGSLAKYLEGFAHTIAVMQTEEALERVPGDVPTLLRLSEALETAQSIDTIALDKTGTITSGDESCSFRVGSVQSRNPTAK